MLVDICRTHRVRILFLSEQPLLFINLCWDLWVFTFMDDIPLKHGKSFLWFECWNILTYSLWILIFSYQWCIFRPDANYELQSFPTKNTPVLNLHFTRRNLLLAAGPYAQWKMCYLSRLFMKVTCGQKNILTEIMHMLLHCHWKSFHMGHPWDIEPIPPTKCWSLGTCIYF